MATSIEYKNARITDSKGRVLKEGELDTQKEGKFSWWLTVKENPDEAAKQVEATCKFLARHNSAYIEQITVSTRMYGNTSAFSLMGSAFTRASSVAPSPSAQRISFNLCSAVIDTLTAQIAKNKVLPTFITSGAKWGLQRKAENLSRFISGCFYENKAHAKTVQGFKDGGIWGDGIVHVYRTESDRVGLCRCLPHEFLEDDVEAMVTGRSMQKHRIHIVDRQTLANQYKDDEDALEIIKHSSPANLQEVSGSGSAGDLVVVTESFRLPTGKDTGDGVYMASMDGQCLKWKEWDKDYYPYPVFQYKRRQLGERGQGAVERLQNLQGEINRLMILIQKSMWMGGSFKVLVKIGSKVVSQHLNNEVGAIINYAGDTPPQYVTPPMIQQDVYPYVDALIEKGFRQEGVSALQASSEVPLGIKSGRAIRDWDKIGDDRQLELGQQFEAFNLEICHQMIEVVKDIFKDKKSYKVTWPGVNFIESIDWKDVNLEADEYYLKAFPTSSLPEEPMAKLETIQEYMQAGLVSPRAGRRLMRSEDLEMADMLANAAEDLICKSIEEILYDGSTKARPDGFWDLQLTKTIGMEYINFARLNNCPEDRLNQLIEWLSYVDEEMGLTQNAAAQPPQAMAGPGGQTGAPQANPMPTPQSNMVPNTAQAVAG